MRANLSLMKTKNILCMSALGVGIIFNSNAQVANASSGRSNPEQSIRQSASTNAVSQQAARRTALTEIQELEGNAAAGARVTGIQAEDDFGARWEVEVTLQSGVEFDVYIDRFGQVVNILRKGVRSSENTRTSPAYASKGARTIALAHIGQVTGQIGRVTGIQREDDFGARWEVEVTLQSGLEYDVYIGPNGQVIRVEELGLDNPSDSPIQESGSAVGQDKAASTALAHIRQMTGQTNARVTGIESEDDYGARWEVEVTLANGSEYDVYIGPNGQVIKAILTKR